MKHPCVFKGPFIKDQVNPRLFAINPKTPFGAFQRDWRRYHCEEINPYGSESCPYAEEDCAIAYLMAAEKALGARKSPVGLFRLIAQKTGYQRAENKPLWRDREQTRAPDLRDGARTRPGHDVGGQAVPRQAPAGGVPDERSVGVRSASHRPQSIGSLLRGDDPGPRTRAYGRHEGKAAAHDDGDGGHPLPEAPPEQLLGNKPSPGDPGLHQGGE